MYVYIFHENFGKYILKSSCAHCSGLYLEAIYSALDPTTAKVTMKMAELVCIYLHYNQPGLQWSVLTQTSNVYFYCLWERWLWLNSQAKPIHAKTINTTHINLFSMPAILQHTVTKQHLRSHLSMCSGRSGLKYKAAPFSLSRVSQSQDLSIIWFVVMTRVAFEPLHMSATAKVSGQLSTWGRAMCFWRGVNPIRAGEVSHSLCVRTSNCLVSICSDWRSQGCQEPGREGQRERSMSLALKERAMRRSSCWE